MLEGFGAVEDMFRAIGGYQAERAADLHDVGQRVIADLMGAPAPGLPVSETPFVLVAEDLSPADTAALDMSKTLAIVTSQGGPTSHTAILARARGIVAVVSAAEAAELENGTNVIVNAAKGEIVVNPSEDEIAAAEAAKSRAAAAKELRGKPGATKDGNNKRSVRVPFAGKQQNKETGKGVLMNIKGVGIGRGVAVGPVIRMAAPLPEPSDAPRAESISAETEIARVEKSLALVNADLNRRAEEAANGDEGAKQAAPILQAIAMFASDPSLAQSIKDLINQGKTAERAVLEGFGAVEDMFRAIGGYQAERAADLHDVGQRVIADLMGAPAPGLPVSETPFVLVAEDLSPADTAALDMSKTLAIVTSQGGPTSHTAILARARGIVAVVSAAEAAELENGTNVIVNAAKGEIVVNPSEDEIAAAEAAKSRAAAAKELRGKPGATKDGHLIPLLANVGKPSDAAKALEYGAEGVGLFRTEFLFIGNSEPPSVEEQTKAYTELLSQFPGKKVVIRMLDAGADKPLPFLTPEDEPNPALGLRGLRTLRAHMDVLEGQLKALAAADAVTDANLWVMAPMVADQHEADYFVKLGKSFGLKFVGAMAEVPSIALMADKVADVADFVSIGTNDLTQYTLAADRTLGSVANYQTAWHPAVLRAIKMICDAGNAKGMPVGVCGEAAADPDLAVVLAGLGVNSLSMTPVALDDVRAALAEVTFEEAKAKAAAALNGDFYKPAE